MSLTEIPSSPARVGPHSNGMLMTAAEYDAIQQWEDGYRYELVHGVLIVTPPPGAGERSPNDDLGYLIRNYQESHPNGSVVDETLPEQDIRVGENRRRADRAVWIGLGRRPLPEEDAPTIAIEFVSKSSRDRHRDYVEKRQQYAAVEVQEYWVIDRFRRSMSVFRAGEEPGEEIVIREGGTYCTPLMPGFELPLDRLLAKADDYSKPEREPLS